MSHISSTLRCETPSRIQSSPPGWLSICWFRGSGTPYQQQESDRHQAGVHMFCFPVKFNTILQYFISWCTKKNPRKQHPRQNWGVAITNPLAVATMSMTLMKATIVQTSIRTNKKHGESLWWLNKTWEWLRFYCLPKRNHHDDTMSAYHFLS